jgi:hypothetical protein
MYANLIRRAVNEERRIVADVLASCSEQDKSVLAHEGYARIAACRRYVAYMRLPSDWSGTLNDARRRSRLILRCALSDMRDMRHRHKRFTKHHEATKEGA